MRKLRGKFETVPLEQVIGKVDRAAEQSNSAGGSVISEPPAVRAQLPHLQTESAATMNEPHAKRILVVDDEECIAETLALILRSSGYEAASLNNGQSALQECARSIPDLVISDVMMPLLNGIELAIQIREGYPRCKILLISGLGGSFDMVEQASKEGHSFEMLSKPIHPVELLSRIRAVLTEDYPQATDQHVTTEMCRRFRPVAA